MSATTWSKFFWSDWESDEALKLCSPGAQALWMRMLCVCAKSDGYLVIAGQALDPADLARSTGWPLSDVKKWWAELAKWKVFSTTSRGKVYSRRMVKEAKRAETARENGKNGGNPSLRKDTENSGQDNPKPTKAPGVRARINHLPEASSKPPNPPEGGVRQDRFAEGWDAYPIAGRGNSGPDKASAEWPRAAERAGGEDALIGAIKAHAARMASDGGRTKNFDRWLRDDGFAAYLSQPRGAVPKWSGPDDVWQAV